MDSMKPAIEFRDIGLQYRISSENELTSFKEWGIRRLLGKGVSWKTVHALRGVTLQAKKGEALGIIGQNGAGKSTLLRIAGGILTPTQGTAVVRGRIAPVIELGIGFEHDLTGIENIFFNGALLGRSRKEMRERLDQIVDFADIGDYIEQPLRTYSTGMVARLAFSIATTVDAQILLLDEVLSVGDEQFKQKCLERIHEFRRRGVTILFVSHDLQSVASFCDRAAWLSHGALVKIGVAKNVAHEYATEMAQRPPDAEE
jgi:ABC-type polysaccharide/polyol phosphate transport system ATPase subunit